MGVSRVKVKEPHDVVFSHDPCVEGATRAGWLPRLGGYHKSASADADVVTVRGLKDVALAQVHDLATAPDTAHLICLHQGIVAVNGNENQKVIKRWVDEVYRADANIIRALSLYVEDDARGRNPVEVRHEMNAEVFGSLPMFPGPVDQDVPAGE